MVVFLTLCALVAVVLYKQIWVAFLNNPGLNAYYERLGFEQVGIKRGSTWSATLRQKALLA